LIETERLVLRPPEPEDAAAIARLFMDPEVMRFIGDGETGAYDDAVDRIERLQRAWAEDGFGTFIVVHRELGAIGRCGLLVWDRREWRPGTRSELGADGEIELGWMLERGAWGHGFATEAAIAARDWALREVAPTRLISLIHPGNTRSMRVAERVGERHEHDVVTHRGITVQLWALASAAQ
jgi:RimJ/RimL family protein N-acetyltransferase